MTNTISHAIRTDRARTAAQGTRLLAPCTPRATAKPTTGTAHVSFAGVPAYVADQESNPPRGGSPA